MTSGVNQRVVAFIYMFIIYVYMDLANAVCHTAKVSNSGTPVGTVQQLIIIYNVSLALIACRYTQYSEL